MKVVRLLFPILSFGLMSALGLPVEVLAQGAAPVAPDTTTELFLGFSPAEVTVGDRFQVVVRVDGPDGTVVEYPEITGSDTIQSVAPVRVAPTAAGDTVAVYTLVAWIAGRPLSATIPVRLRSATTVTTLPVALRLPRVVSVLPAGDTIVEPKPAKPLIVPSLLGASSSLWILLLLAALVAGIVGLWLLDRRRRNELDEEGDPRSWALAKLGTIGQSATSTVEQRQERYRRVSRLLRLYIARIDLDRGLDLTTTELLSSLGDDVEPTVLDPLARLLGLADRVKFAGVIPTEPEADGLIDDARTFIRAYPRAASPAPTVGPRRAA